MTSKWIVGIMAVLLALTATASANDWTLWGLTGDGADHSMGVRVGIERDQIEFGGTAAWWTADPLWGPEPQAGGAYLIFHIDETVQVEDPAPDNSWEQFLHAFIGRPYVGIEGLIPGDGPQRTLKLNYLIGTVISTSDDFKTSLAIEWVSGQGVAADNDQMVRVGVRITF